MTNILKQMADNYLYTWERKLQQTNPEMYKMYLNARQGGVNPNDLLKKLTSGYDDKTRQAFKEQAKQFGITDDLLKDI